LLNKVHHYIRKKSQLYAGWHSFRFHSHIHWGVFGLFSTLTVLKILAVALTMSLSFGPASQAFAVTQMWSSEVEWETGTGSQIDTTTSAGDVTLSASGGGADTPSPKYIWFNDNGHSANSTQNINFPGTAAFTIEVWVKVDADHSGWGGVIVDTSLNGLYVDNTTGVTKVLVDSGVTALITGTTNLRDGTWHHLAWTRDGSNNNKLWVDGAQEGTTPSNTSNSSIGTRLGLANTAEGLKGALNDLRVSNSERYSSGFVSPPRGSLSTDANTIVLLKIDDATGTNLNDSSTNNNDYTIQGGQAWVQKQGMAFDGSNDYLYAVDDNTLDLTGSLTIEGWYTFYAWTGAVQWFGTKHGTNRRYTFYKDSGDNKLYFRYDTTSGVNVEVIDTSGYTPTLGERVHLAVSVNTSTNEVKFFANGTLLSTISNNFTTNPLISGDGSYFVGQLGNSTQYGKFLMDEHRISNSARYSGNFTPDATFSSDANSVLIWNIDEGTGTSLADNSPNTNTGIVSGATWQNGDASTTYLTPGTDTIQYDTGAENVMQSIAWNATTPAGTAVKAKVRAASTQGGLAAATYSSYITASGNSFADGDLTGQWVEVEWNLSTTDTSVTPTLADGTLTYALTNATPTVGSLGGASLVNGSSTADTTPGAFTFTTADTDGDNVFWQIQIDNTDNTFASAEVDYTSASAAAGASTFSVGQAVGGGTYNAGTADTTLAEGSYYWRVMVTDANAAASSWSTANSGSVAFKVDTSNPSTPSISAPTDASTISDTTPTLTSSAFSDTYSTHSASQWLIDTDSGFAAPILVDTSDDGANLESYTPSALDDGTYYAKVRYKDSAANYSEYSTTVSFIVDATVPSAPTITLPSSATTINAASYSITGTAEANALVTVYIDLNNDGDHADLDENTAGTQQLTGGGTSFSISATITADSANNFLVTAKDAQNNESTVADVYTITEDSTAPSAPVVSLPSGSVTVNAASYSVTGTAEANSLVTVYTDPNNDGNHSDGVSAGTQQLTGGGTAYSIAVTLTADTTHNFTATAKDSANNESVTDANVPTIIEDSTAPSAPAVSDPSGSTTLNAANYEITGTAEANALVTVYTDVDNDGTVDDGIDESAGTAQLTDGGTAFSITAVLAQNSANNFTVTAADIAGNESTPTNVATLTEDSAGPTTPTIASPTASQRTNDTTPTIATSTFADTFSTHLATQWLIYASTCSGDPATDSGDDSTNKTSYTPSALDDGDYCTKVRYKDSTGNYSSYSSTVTFTVDTTAPSAPTSVSVAKANSLGGLTITWTDPVASDLSTIDIYRSTASGTEGSLVTTVAGGVQTYTDSSLSNNTAYYYTLKATDTASNTSSGTSQASQTTHVSPTKLVVVAPGQTFSSGSAVSGSVTAQTAGTAFSISVYGVDASNNLGLLATDSVTITSGDTQATVPSATALASGTKAFSVTLKTAGSKTVTASASGLTSGSATISISALGASATTSALVASDDSVFTGDSATLTATVKDVYSNALSGQTVVLSSSRSGDTLTQPTSTTTSAGVASGEVTSTTAGESAITATVGSTTIGTTTITFTATATTNSTSSNSSNSSSSSTTTSSSSSSSSSNSSSDSSSSVTTTPALTETVDTTVPTATISVQKYAIVGGAVIFDGSESSDDVAITSYTWTFPDGSNSTLTKPTYIFTDSGDKEISLTVKDKAGNNDTVKASVYVLLPKPVIESITQVANDIIVTGTADPYSTVIIYVFPEPKTFRTVADGNGYYELKIKSSQLGEGEHHFTAVAMNKTEADDKTIMEKITEEIVKPAVALQIAENKSQDEPQALSDLKPVTVTLENPIVSNRAMIYLGGWLFVIILIIIGYLITKKKRKTVNKLN